MGCDIASLRTASEVGDPFQGVYARLLERIAEKWHKNFSMEEAIARQLKGSARDVYRQLSNKDLLAHIQSNASTALNTKSEGTLEVHSSVLDDVIAELNRRVLEKRRAFDPRAQ